MSVQTDQSDKPVRRKRRTPHRRVPAIVEQRPSRPFAFGWGAELTKQEREALKEKIALFGGIALAVVLAALLGWGWYQDNIAAPAARAADNNTPIAQVGSYTIKKGFFKSFESFEQSNLNAQLSQLQNEISQAQANTKKYGKVLPQLQARQSAIQQQLQSLAQNALNTIITDQTVLQAGPKEGVYATPALTKKTMKTIEDNAGGKLHLVQQLAPSGLSLQDFQTIAVAEAMGTQLQKKLTGSVPHYQVKVRASHILVPTKDHALALRLLKEAKAGANFAALAHKYSKDTVSAKKGGDLGYFTKGTMVAAFDKAAFSMKVGQVRLVKSQFGWHVIKLTGRKNARLTSAEYQQSQQTAFNTWITKQEALLGVRRYVAANNLPGSQTTSPNLPSQLQAPQQAPQVPAPAKSKSGTNTGQSQKKH